MCNPDRIAISVQLDKLLRRLTVLPLHLTPGQAPPGVRVTTSRTGSAAPARLDVLSLLGHGGAVNVAAQRPLVRRWHTLREVDVEKRVGASVERSTVVLREWHQELVRDPDTGEPVLVDDDDQTGVTPPREWLGQQVDAWRAVFGHQRRPPTRVPGAGPDVPALPADFVQWATRNGTPKQVAELLIAAQVLAAGRQAQVNLIAGHAPGLGDGSKRPPELREDDPLADEWELRFGETTTARAPADNVRYLQTWLDRACERDDLDLGRFAAELRVLDAELGRVLGEQPDQWYLGRCPATIVDRDGEGSSRCGATLWQDPHASVVTCWSMLMTRLSRFMATPSRARGSATPGSAV